MKTIFTCSKLCFGKGCFALPREPEGRTFVNEDNFSCVFYTMSVVFHCSF